MTGDEALIEAVGGLVTVVEGLRSDISETRLYGQRTRRTIRIVAASVAFDIALSVGLYLGYRKADQASARASRASSAQVVSCRAGNESRKIETDLWDTVLGYSVIAPSNETPDARAAREQQTQKFKDYIAKAFAQKDCSKETS